MSEQRRLAAIVAADVVGYSRLMGRDESGTVARLRAHRSERLEPVLKRHGGRIVKLTGDGALMEFASAVEAVAAAIEFQRRMAEANNAQPEDSTIVFRIGVHLGDLIVDADDLYGDGVNVAARLEGEAPAGGIVVSGAIFEATSGRVDAGFEDLGRLRLKNIERPVQAYAVRWGEARTVGHEPQPADAPLALPDRPSIAVLPFQNMSGDPEQEYFADGMVEDIITALSRFKSLFVIARNSSFTYKGKAVDIKRVGRELGVRYVLEGSVRKAGGRVRITGQLIDSQTGSHLWADRFDGSVEDVFDLQDEVTKSVVGRIAPKVTEAEIERAKRKPVENLDAYDWFLRGMAKVYEHSFDAWPEAFAHFGRAIELDPRFAPPYAMCSRYYNVQRIYRRIGNRPEHEAEVRRLAAHVSTVGTDDAFSLCWAGHSLMMVCGDHDGCRAMVEDAIAVNDNLAACWQVAGSLSMYSGQHELAVEQLSRALRFNPVGPDSFQIAQSMAAACLHLDRFSETLAWSAKALRHNPNHTIALQMSAVAHVHLGDTDEARRLTALVSRINPAITLSSEKDLHPFRRAVEAEKWLTGLRLAGLPE